MNLSLKMALIAASLSCLVLLSGCRSAKPKVQLNIFNYTDETLRNVEILQEGQPRYKIATLLPNRGIDRRPGGDTVPAVSTVRFTMPDGRRVERNLQPAEQVAKYFTGNIYYQIENKDEVRAFYMPNEGKAVSSMPWNTPAAFEGNFNVPGMGAN